MVWNPFIILGVILVAAALLVWDYSRKKNAGKSGASAGSILERFTTDLTAAAKGESLTRWSGATMKSSASFTSSRDGEKTILS